MRNFTNLPKGGKILIATAVGYTANYLHDRLADKTTGVTAAKERFETELKTKVDQNAAELKSIKDQNAAELKNIKDQVVNIDKKLDNLDKKVTDLLNKGISKLLPDLDNINLSSLKGFFNNINLSSLKEFFDTLTIYQVGCIFDILICSGIATTLIEILAIKFGNELIKYYDLENKYPKLAIFFKIRAKYQRYVLIFNVILIFVFCFLGILVNIYMFFL